MSDTEYTVSIDLDKLPRALPEIIFEPGCSECAELEVKLAAAEARAQEWQDNTAIASRTINDLRLRAEAAEAREKVLRDVLLEADFALDRATFPETGPREYPRCSRARKLVRDALANAGGEAVRNG